jgi:hypothetical protein
MAYPGDRTLSGRSPAGLSNKMTVRRDGRVVDGGGLENLFRSHWESAISA